VWSSDTLFALEQHHLVQLALWSGASLALGVLLLVLLRIRRAEAPLLTHFALQMTLWGAGELVLAALWWHDLAARDFAGAVRLTTFLRFAIVAEVACLVLGATLAIAGWTLTRKLAALGAGVAVVVQCAALLALDAALLARMAGAA
jgi:hypothetical protein